MKKISNLTLLLLLLALLFSSAAPVQAYESLTGLTETRYWDQSSAYNGYTLFAGAGKSYLIDMEGRVVHTWNAGTNPRLLENGHILDATKDDPSGFGGFQELDWNSKVVWSYTETRSTYHPHHDFIRIFNPKLNAYTTLYIANKDLTNAECLAAGCDPKNAPYNGAQMDAIVEVDMNGKIIWEWSFFDHVVQDIDASKPNYVGAGKTVADYPGRINLNLPGQPVRKDWLHCNSLDYNQALDQIVINSVQGEFYVIDHGGTFNPGDPAASIAKAAGAAGDFLYRFGDPARYNQGQPPSVSANWTMSTAGNKQIGGSHDIHWIANGLPGAGNFMVFNNSQYLFERTPQSYVVEINPYLDASKKNTGRYVNPPDAGYYKLEFDKDTHKTPRQISNQVVSLYFSKSNQAFFSHIGGSAQRLPSGNTLVCSDTEGHLFEVKADGTLVWEYINPVTRDGILTVMPDSLPMTNSVFRAYRYAANYVGLSGQTLTAGNTLTGRTPDYLTPTSTGSGSLKSIPAALPSTSSSSSSSWAWLGWAAAGLGLFVTGGVAGGVLPKRARLLALGALLLVAMISGGAWWFTSSWSRSANAAPDNRAPKAANPAQPAGKAAQPANPTQPASQATQPTKPAAPADGAAGKEQTKPKPPEKPQAQPAAPASSAPAAAVELSALTPEMCLRNTSGGAQAKDCCDCLPGATAETIKACRDAAATNDYSQNSKLISFTVPSTLGPEGDYNSFTSAGNQQACKLQCDSSTALSCGDRRFCRDACAKLPEK